MKNQAQATQQSQQLGSKAGRLLQKRLSIAGQCFGDRIKAVQHALVEASFFQTYGNLFIWQKSAIRPSSHGLPPCMPSMIARCPWTHCI